MFKQPAKRLFIDSNVRGILLRSVTTEPQRFEKSLNQIQLLGRVGAEPQKRGTELHPVVTFSLATHSNYKNEAGDLTQKTEWHRVCVFKPGLRETVYNYLRKGQRVHVTGKLIYGEIKDDSGPRSTASVAADDVIFFQSN